MSIDLERFHKSFFEESFEGLDTMEQALLELDPNAPDAEGINLIFRSAHSIKGGAATFGFAGVAEYTHGVETLLDQMRSGKRTIQQNDVDLFLRIVDVLRGLLRAARDGASVDASAVASTQAEIAAALANGSGAKATEVVAQAKPADEASSGWLIQFEPKPDLFRSGNDPLRILRGVGALGEMKVEVDVSKLPSFADADIESCYLAWTLKLESTAPKIEVEEQFTWVEDESYLRISPLQHAPVAAAAAVSETPSGKPALTLVQGGAGTEAAVPAPVASTQAAANTARTGDSSSIRVSTEKIDALINLVGELVITQAMLEQQASSLDPAVNEKLLAGLSQLNRNTRQLQEAVMSTRMLPIESVFSRFPRVVRDLAAKLNKQVRLTTVGESTELDKSVIEKIADPLNHLVRNSLDHGIETPEQRIAAGKDPSGTITLKASHQGGHIIIEVIDDGRGLDRTRILDKARANGLPVSDTMSNSEVWQLIFTPGFSTAEKVTDVSGRGVGMDVVKKNIAALGGSVELNSDTGSGSRTVIRLPLTLAILDGMSIAVGTEVFILPLSSVVESLQPTQEQVKSVAGSGQVVRVRNEYVPLLALSQLFNIHTEVRDAHNGILVLLEADGRKLALQVDELVGQQQVVIKSLEANYKRIPYISGATILGDGRVALIIDVADLIRASNRAAAA